MNQTDLQGETERALRAITCTDCARDVPMSQDDRLRGDWHTRNEEHWPCTSKHAELLPLFNAGMEQAHSQDEKFTYCAYCGHREAVDVDGSVIAQHIRTCDKHPAREWEKQAVAGAYAAAAKRFPCLGCDAQIFVAPEDRHWTPVIDGKHWKPGHVGDKTLGYIVCPRATILALTPADARQAQQSYKADLARDLQQDPEYSLEYLKAAALDSKEALEGAVTNVMGQAIASAEARARLEGEYEEAIKFSDAISNYIHKSQWDELLKFANGRLRETKTHVLEFHEAATRPPDSTPKEKT